MAFAYFNRGSVQRQGRRRYMKQWRADRAEKIVQRETERAYRAGEESTFVENQNPERTFGPEVLNDGDKMVFGKHRKLQTRMCDVPMKYWRWFLEQEWCAQWPAVKAYAESRTSASQKSTGANGGNGE